MHKYHFNLSHRIIAELKSQLSVEKEKRETLEKELDIIRRQLFQAKESMTHYESLLTEQQIPVSKNHQLTLGATANFSVIFMPQLIE